MKENRQIKKLVEVCEKTSNINWVNNAQKEYKYIDLSAVSRETLQITGHQYINSANAPSRAKKIVLNNDVIFATTRPTLKRATIINNDFHGHICSTGFSVLRPKNDEALSKYVFYTLLTDAFMAYVEKLQKGASYPAITDNEVKAYPIPIPPIPEQKRIVKILDKAFAAIAEAKANAKKNLQNSRELFDSYLNKVFANPGGDWEEKKLGKVCFLKSGTTISKRIEKSTGKILYVKVADMNLKGNEISINNSTRFVDLCDIKKNQIIPIGSVIFPKRGGAIFTNKKRKIVKPTIVDLNTMAIVPSQEIYKNFLYYWFLKIDLSELNNGSSIPQINNYSFDEVKIVFPKSITSQKKIVAVLDRLFIETQNLKSIYRQKLTDLEELKKSILQKAFEGEL